MVLRQCVAVHIMPPSIHLYARRMHANELQIPSPQEGRQCVNGIATATSLLRTQIQQWRKDPNEKEELAQEVELKSVADIQNEIDTVVDSSKLLEDEFQDDEEGEKYRNAPANAGLLLKAKVIPYTLHCTRLYQESPCRHFTNCLYHTQQCNN